MTLEQANELIEYFNKHILFRLPEHIVDHIAAIPVDPKVQSDYMFESAKKNYDQEYQNKIKKEDLTIGIYYFETDFVAIHFALLSEEWLDAYNANSYLPKRFRKMLPPAWF